MAMPNVSIWLTIDEYEWQCDEIELGIWTQRESPDEIEWRGDENLREVYNIKLTTPFFKIP